MPDCEGLLVQARRKPSTLRFDEVLALAECNGFSFARQRGSHKVYKRTGIRELLNFQPDKNGMAKATQVRQLLRAIDAIRLDDES